MWIGWMTWFWPIRIPEAGLWIELPVATGRGNGIFRCSSCRNALGPVAKTARHPFLCLHPGSEFRPSPHGTPGR